MRNPASQLTSWLIAAIVCIPLGCGSEPKKTDDPEEIEKARQKHAQTMRREADEAGRGR